MAKISIDPAKTKPCITRLEDVARNLKELSGTLDDIRGNLGYKIAGQAQISARLRDVSGQIVREETAVRSMRDGLERIVSQYQRTEDANLGRVAPDENASFSDATSTAIAQDLTDSATIEDYIRHFDIHDPKDVLDLILRLGLPATSPELAMLYQTYKYLETKFKVSKYASGIRDEATRKLVNENYHYGYRMMEAYQNADGKSRQVLDKFNSEIKIADVKNADGSLYDSSDGTFHLNVQESLNDPRKAEKVFYHEYGHYVVDQKKWVYYDNDGVHESESFARFHQALDREAKAYIADAETRARDQLHAQYDGKLNEQQIESLVHNRAVQIMKQDTGNAKSHEVNGISDILGAASNSQYSIGYGHSLAYWGQNWTRQGNEGFAQFFSADVNHNAVEIEFMKQHFPEAYREYQNLLDEALQ